MRCADQSIDGLSEEILYLSLPFALWWLAGWLSHAFRVLLKIKQDRVSLKNVLASSPRTIWVPWANCRKVVAGGGGCPDSERGKGRFSKLETSRLEALTRTLRGLSTGARIPMARMTGFRVAVRRWVMLRRMHRAVPDAADGPGADDY